MAKYTTLLRSICESVSGLTESVGNNDTDSVIATARPLIFSFNYPVIPDVTPKEELETKILRHFYFREIGFETYGQWKFFLQNRMNEIMPYYNQLYQSTFLEFNPFDDVNYSKTHYGNETGTGHGTQEDHTSRENEYADESTRNDDSLRTVGVNGTKWEYYSDTPQGSVSRIDIDGNNYLTNATKNTDANNTTDTYGNETTNSTEGTNSETGSAMRTTDNTFSSNDHYTDTVKGKLGVDSYSRRLEEYRRTMLNIDMMVIEELNDLFMNVY